MPRRCGVLGSPIAHSLSPTLHLAAYRALGLDWSYDATDVAIDALPGFVAGLGAEWRGLSLTMPLKEAALALCDTVDRTAKRVGGVNTLLLDEPAGVVGHNTDVTGFVEAWRAAGITEVDEAVVVGAGATARSAAAALAQIGARRIVVLVRSPQRAHALEDLLDVLGIDFDVYGLTRWEAVEGADLVVATLPGEAMAGLGEAMTGLAASAGGVSDVVYAPRATPLVEAARRAGKPCADGFDLLLHQAVRQVELMTGASAAPLEAMREAGLMELARREDLA